VREGGPRRLWEKAETVLDAYDAADCPSPETFRLDVTPSAQVLRHPRLPELHLARG
jgi:hypothetical protein